MSSAVRSTRAWSSNSSSAAPGWASVTRSTRPLNRIIQTLSTDLATSSNISCPVLATSAPTTSPCWNAPLPMVPSAPRAPAKCARIRYCRPLRTPSSTLSASVSTICRLRRRRCCARSRPRAVRALRRGAEVAMAVRSNIVGIDSPEALEKALRGAYYLTDEGLATAAYLGLALGKPLLLEGAPGVGKTEAAKAIAAVLGRRLIRLQCYEGIDASAALYEWNYPRQMLAIRQAGDESIDIYGETFLIERPMLATLRAPDSTVLLIDEIDRADQEFEAFLLEFLSDFQISIPERGTVRASERPVVILTSNRTRDLHEALRRRCVYHWIDYPDAEREARIVMLRASGVAEATARAVVAAVGRLRREPLSKAPGIAEAVDWAEAATLLHQGGARWPDAFKRAIGVSVTDETKNKHNTPRLDALIAEAAA